MVLLFLVLALALAVTFLGGMQKALSGGWRDVLRPLVADYVDRLAADIGAPPDVVRAQVLVQRLPLSIRIEGPAVNWDSHPQRRREFGRRWHDGGTPPPARGDGTEMQDEDGAWWLLTRSTADGHRIRFGLGDAGWQGRPRFIGWATLAVLLLMTALAYAYVRHLMRPLRDIRAGAVRFGQGDFSKPIAVRRRDEVGDLAGQVNAMASGLHHMLDAKRQLLLAISHELRSPLTRARLNAELVPDSDDAREPRTALLRDLAEMGTLITELLESERLSAGHAALQREDADLNALVAEVIATQFDGRGVRFEPAAALPRLQLDPMRIKLLLRNLLDNALRHSAGAPQPPAVATALDGSRIVLSVRDFGPGVPPEQLPRLAEAFYRTDTARQRSTGGVGLGLYLCKLVAQAHGGAMSLRNAEPGLAVEVALPVGPPAFHLQNA
jgi:signal transduction histidine kinase